VAGLLNIFAIYDPYEGPAYLGYEDEPASRESSSRQVARELEAEGSV